MEKSDILFLTALITGLLTRVITETSEDEMCDVQSWYSSLLEKGVFDQQLTLLQQETKECINELLLSEKVKHKCSELAKFKAIMLPDDENRQEEPKTVVSKEQTAEIIPKSEENRDNGKEDKDVAVSEEDPNNNKIEESSNEAATESENQLETEIVNDERNAQITENIKEDHNAEDVKVQEEEEYKSSNNNINDKSSELLPDTYNNILLDQDTTNDIVDDTNMIYNNGQQFPFSDYFSEMKLLCGYNCAKEEVTGRCCGIKLCLFLTVINYECPAEDPIRAEHKRPEPAVPQATDAFESITRTSSSEQLQRLELNILHLENEILKHKYSVTEGIGDASPLSSELLSIKNELAALNDSLTKMQRGGRAYGDVQRTVSDLAMVERAEDEYAIELIKAQQSKLDVLTEMIHNHIAVVSELGERTRHLQEENRVLLEKFLVQSEAMNELMERLVNITEQQTKQTELLAIINSRMVPPSEGGKRIEVQDLTSGQYPNVDTRVVDLLSSDEERLEYKTQKNQVSSDTESKPKSKSKVIKNVIKTAEKKEKKKRKKKKTGETNQSKEKPEQRKANVAVGDDDNDDKIKMIKSKGNEKPKKTIKKSKSLSEMDPRDDEKRDVNNVTKESKEDGSNNNEANIKYLEDESNRKEDTKGGPKPTQSNGGTKDEQPGHTTKDEETLRDTGSKGEDQEESKNDDWSEKLEDKSKPRYYDPTYKGPKDCYDHYKFGRKRDMPMKIKPVASPTAIEVFCDMKNGGWTIIQRRFDGSLDFFRDWDEYKRGFGSPTGELWLGNDNIHFLTNQDNYSLRIEMMDWDRGTAYAEYDQFYLDDEANGYRIHVSGYRGDAGDSLAKHDGHKFSTKDVDNDTVDKEFGGSCARRFTGAWWFYRCFQSSLNGKYYKGGRIPEKRFDGVMWKSWKGSKVSLKKVEMKIRRKL